MKPLFFFIAFLLFLTACETGRKLNPALQVTGKVGEIQVVCEKSVWEGPIKNVLDSTLVQYILPYIPDVPTFQLIHKTPRLFTQGVRRHRNILFLKIDPKHQGNGKITQQKDVWAKGQLVFTVVAKDYNQLIKTCAEGLPKVHDIFDEYSWKRILKYFSHNKRTSVHKKINQNFGIDIVLPARSRLVTSKKNFFRIEFPPASRPIEFVGKNMQDPGTILYGVMIYQYDFIDSSQFELKNLLQARDTMLKYNVPHEIEGMYMGTQYNPIVYPIIERATSFDGKIEGYDIRGMFQFIGPKFGTGGAFWEFHFRHPKRNKIICISGYVDAPPTTTWTHPLREVQAVLKSVKIIK